MKTHEKHSPFGIRNNYLVAAAQAKREGMPSWSAEWLTRARFWHRVGMRSFNANRRPNLARRQAD